MTESASTFRHLNEPAPDFKAKTTHGDRSLADYKGMWLILFSAAGHADQRRPQDRHPRGMDPKVRRHRVAAEDGRGVGPPRGRGLQDGGLVLVDQEALMA